MSILGKYINEEEEQETSNYRIPAVFRGNQKDMSLTKSIMVSTAIHPLAVFLVWLFIFIAGLLGISFVIFNKPEAKPKDIEFVLVDKENTPINKNTRFRADRNSRAGGKHNPKKKVSMPKAGGGGAAVKKPQKSAQSTSQSVQKKIKKSFTDGFKKQEKPSGPAKVKAPTPAPRAGIMPSAPRTVDKPKTAFAFPVPKTNIPKIGAPAGTGPIASPSGTGAGTSKSGSGTVAGGTGSGAKFAPVGSGSGSGKYSHNGSGGGNGTGVGRGTGSGVGVGNVGNPGPGNPNGRPGIDAIREPDFGPYMRELQQRIKRNWEPPKGEESRRVVLLFSIAKDGRLLNVRVSKSSGLAAADNAAIAAVKLTAPFKPLPPEYRENSVDIQFTFDYNVFGAKKY